MGTEQAAASTCLPSSRLARGCDAQGSPGEAGPADRLADLHQEVAKTTPRVQTELPRVEESSCRSLTLPGSLPKLQMTPLLGDYSQTSD